MSEAVRSSTESIALNIMEDVGWGEAEEDSVIHQDELKIAHDKEQKLNTASFVE